MTSNFSRACRTHLCRGLFLCARTGRVILSCWSVGSQDDIAVCEAAGFYDLYDQFRATPSSYNEAAILNKYLRLGFVVQFTACQGDCSPDAIALELGLENNPGTWKRIRSEAAKSMKVLARAPWFQHSFKACQEYDGEVQGEPQLRPAKSSASDPPPAGLSPAPAPPNSGPAPAGLDPAALGPALAPAGLVAPAAAGSAPELPGEAAALIAAGDVGEGDEMSASLLKWALSQTSVGQALLDADGGDWLRSEVPQEEQLSLKRKFAASTRPQALASKVPTKLGQREKLGLEYLAWRSTDGAESSQPLADFLRQRRGYGKDSIPKKDRQRLYNAMKSCERLSVSVTKVGKGYKRKGTAAKTKRDKRFRDHGRQGRPHKCAELRVLLFDWFCDVRGSLAGRLWPRDLKAQAVHLMKRVKKRCNALRIARPAFPVITGKWIKEFCHEKGISLKHPNRKYKVLRAPSGIGPFKPSTFFLGFGMDGLRLCDHMCIKFVVAYRRAHGSR